MLPGRMKRPSSARRNIKQELFSPFVSGSRLRNLQRLLGDEETTGRKIDAILCISGIDSRYNDGTTELFNYLLFGFFNVRKDELEESGIAEEILDDVIFLIQKDQVDIYCNPINYQFLLPYTSHWRNVQYHCLTEDEYEKDEEEAEEFKINSFISLVEHCQNVGIAYSNSVSPQPFDKMAIERWPIIQAYALDEYGGGGFFTMKHEVTDISKSLHSIYSLIDPVALETLVTEQLVLFRRQWQTLVNTIDVEIEGSDDGLTEKKVCEVVYALNYPLTSYYLHGRVGNHNPDHSSDNNRRPYVYFGCNSKNVGAQLESGMDNVRKTGLGRKPAKHMVCQAITPRGPLCCSRTYFFSRFRDPFQDVAHGDEDKELRFVIELYSIMVECVLDGIQTFAATQSSRTAEARLTEQLHRKCSDLKELSLGKYLEQRNNVEFIISAVDNYGCLHPVGEGKSIQMVKNASLILHNVPSIEQPGRSIGSLVFSESFLESVLQIEEQGGGKSSRFEVLLLTSNVPRFLSWAIEGITKDERESLVVRMKEPETDNEFGELLMSGDLVMVGCLAPLCSPLIEEHLFVYKNALIIFHPKVGGFVLQGIDVESVQFYDGESASVVAVLLLKYKNSSVRQIPVHFQSHSSTIIITATPKSKAYKQLFSEPITDVFSKVSGRVFVQEAWELCPLLFIRHVSWDMLHALQRELAQVLPLWKNDSSFPSVEKLSDLPECYQKLHKDLQTQYQHTDILNLVSPLKRSTAVLPDFDRFLTHFLVSSVGLCAVLQQDLPILLNTGDDKQKDLPVNKEALIVTVLSGVPGSYQDKVCQALTELSKEQNRWTVLKQPVGSAEPFRPAVLQQSLSAVWNIHRRPRLTNVNKRTRILLIVQSNTEIVDVVQAIYNHPTPEIRAQVKIGAVTACVDPLNTFLQHRLTYSLLLNHCAQGWVNNIVFTSSTATKNPILQPVQELLRCANSDVSFMLAEGGQVTRSSDIDAILSETAFHQPEKVRARHLLYPGWSDGSVKFLPLMQNISLKFTQCLEKGKLLKKLKGLKSSLAQFPLAGNIYYVCGKVRFTEAEQTMELEYVTLSGSLKLKPVEIQPAPPSEVNGTGIQNVICTSSIVFSGYNLQETTLKDWLRGCAKQIPQKKTHISRKDLMPEEIKKIHEKRHLETLPPGWFFNGTNYISFSGDKQTTHPGTESFVQDHLKQKNKEIDEYNVNIDEATKHFTDLFA